MDRGFVAGDMRCVSLQLVRALEVRASDLEADGPAAVGSLLVETVRTSVAEAAEDYL